MSDASYRVNEAAIVECVGIVFDLTFKYNCQC